MLALAAALVALLAGCANSPQQTVEAAPGVLEQIRDVDLRSRSVENVRLPEGGAGADGPRAQSYFGTAEPPIAGGERKKREADNSLTTGSLSASATGEATARGFELNFENAPVAAVVRTILGDILGVGYTLDPRVQGTVTLSSGRPVPKKDLLYVLESALRASNVSLVRDRDGYRLVPATDALGTATVDDPDQAEAGYGISVIPLQYVSAQTLGKLLDSFATKQGSVRADPGRNLIIVQGNAADRQAAIDTILSFDADWMRGQSVGIYPVTNSAPEPVIAELDKIIDSGEGGLSQNLVKLQPIARQNAVLVVTRKPDMLKMVSTWITRLDKAGVAGTGVKVYRMRYGDARQVATLLNEMFVGGGGNVDAPINQLAPQGGAMASHSNRYGPPAGGGLGGQQPSAASSLAGAAPGTGAGTQLASNLAPPGQGLGMGRDTQLGGAGATGGRPIMPDVRIAADRVNNAVLVYANQDNYRIIERTLQQLDRPQLQVAIDATIAEVTLNDKLNYGVQFFLKSQNFGLNPDRGSVSNSNSPTTPLPTRVLPGFNFLVGMEADPRLILSALHSVTEVKILSTPSLVVVDNQFASLLVGDQIPVTTRTAQSVDVPTAPIVNSIDYRNTGVILRVAPRINVNGNVMLDIEQEISAVAQTPTAETLTPTVSQRMVRSTIAVASGQTVLLGGLISERQDRGSDGIPLLDQAPGVLSGLFSTKTGTTQRTELVIFIRPKIIRNGNDARRVAEDLRDKMINIFGPPPLPPPPPPAPPAPQPPQARRASKTPVAMHENAVRHEATTSPSAHSASND
jgi:general secretion pathway protein D